MILDVSLTLTLIPGREIAPQDMRADIGLIKRVAYRANLSVVFSVAFIVRIS